MSKANAGASFSSAKQIVSKPPEKPISLDNIRPKHAVLIEEDDDFEEFPVKGNSLFHFVRVIPCSQSEQCRLG